MSDYDNSDSELKLVRGFIRDIKILVEALDYYANKHHMGVLTKVERDRYWIEDGEVARKALIKVAGEKYEQ